MPAIATQEVLDVRSAAWSDDDAKVDEALLGSFPGQRLPTMDSRSHRPPISDTPLRRRQRKGDSLRRACGSRSRSRREPHSSEHAPIEPSLRHFRGNDVQRGNRCHGDEHHARQRHEPEYADERQIGYGDGQRDDRHC